MRYLIPLILMCSLAGYSQAQDRLNQLPSNTSEVQIRGQTYYQHGSTFYRFHPQGGYYYEVQPPSNIRQYDQPQHLYRRGQTQPSTNMSTDQVEGCRNMAADKANANPATGGKVYIREYNRCINMLNQN